MFRLRGRLSIAAIAIVLAAGCGRAKQGAEQTTASRANRGGQLVVSIKAEPQSFNWYIKHDAGTDLVTRLTQTTLVRINRVTGEVEPWLAESWTQDPNGLKYLIKLRPNLTFADGHPFTADDVVFSMAAAYDEKSGSILGDSLQIAGHPLKMEAIDDRTIAVTLPSRFSPGLRLLDNLVILPKHKLASTLADGTFANAWSLNAPLDSLTGLGPFVLSEYHPGQRLLFARNPKYFRKDESGQPLPYLDRLVAEVVPEPASELLRLQSGELDMTSSEIRPEDYAPLKRAADAGRLRLLDLGPALDPESLWFNLNPDAFRHDSRRGWLQQDELRQAISLAVDRRRFVDEVYLGAAIPTYGPVTPSNKKWFSPAIPPTPHDPDKARQLLKSIGLADRNGDGMLEDASGGPARFALLTQKGQTSLERGCAFVSEELKKIGLQVDVVALERNAVIQRFLSGAGYDAVYFHIGTTDTDPAINPDFWLSSGSSHVWHLMQQKPATAWEARLDELMRQQSSAGDESERKRLFDQMQLVFAEHAPIVYFAAPRVFITASARVSNLTPAVSRPQLLWAADTLAVKP